MNRIGHAKQMRAMVVQVAMVVLLGGVGLVGAADGGGTAPRCDISATAAGVSADFPAASMREAIAALAAATGVEVHWMRDDGNETVATRFTHARLSEAVARLLPHRGYLLIVGGRDRGPAQLWIGAIVPGRELPRWSAPVDAPRVLAKAGAVQPGNLEGEVAQLVAAADLPSAEAEHYRRLDAVAALTARVDDPTADAALLQTLQSDPSDDVRAAAFASLRGRDAIPTSALLDIAMHDGPPALRWPAVELLRERLDVDQTAVAALTQLANGDTDQAIQDLAQQALLGRTRGR